MPLDISASRFGDWQHTQLIIHVVPRRSGMFSHDGLPGLRFPMRSRPYADGEWAHVLAPPRRKASRDLPAAHPLSASGLRAPADTLGSCPRFQ